MGKGNLKTAFLLQMLFSPFLAAETQQTGVFSSMQCLNNYGIQHRRVDCTWHRNQTVGEGPFYLNFSDTYQMLPDLICQLSPSSKAQDELSCSAQGPGNFEEKDDYQVSLHDASLGIEAACTVWENYKPMLNIKCDPPFDLRSNMSTSKCHITWKKPKAYEIIWKALQWQLEFRATHMAWEQTQTKTVVTSETWMEIDGSEFKSGISYVARMRCKTPDSDDAYVSQWSEWSADTEWKVPSGALQWGDSLVLPALLISVPLCLGGLLFLLLVSRFYSRIKSHCLASTPNPAAFFLPLYTRHNGDFQDWIGIKDRDLWLRSGNAGNPRKDDGHRTTTHRALEVISYVSSSGTELPSEERVCCLPGALDRPDKASKYIVMQGEQKLPGEAKSHLLSGRVSLHLEGLNATGEGFPYFPYKNTLFVAQGEQDTESITFCSEASSSPGTSSSSSHQGSDLCRTQAVDPRREAEQGAERLVTARKAPCKQVLVLLPTQASPTPFWLIQADSSA